MAPSATAGQGDSASVPILVLPPGFTRTVLFLGPLSGTLQHYVGKRSFLCKKKSGACSYCARERTVFYAYAPGRHYRPEEDSWYPVVIQCTANLEESLRGRKIRGEVWDLTRTPRKDKRGPVVGCYRETLAEELLTPAFSILKPLQRLFGELEIDLTAENLTPTRLVQPVVQIPLKGGSNLPQPSTPPPAIAGGQAEAEAEAHKQQEEDLEQRIREREEYMKRAYRRNGHQ